MPDQLTLVMQELTTVNQEYRRDLHKIPQQLIAECRADVVLSYIESIASGFVG